MKVKSYFWLVAALAITSFAPSVAAQVSSGTAFAIAPGLLITNQHVIAGCSSVEVITKDGRRTGAIVDADDQIDLALLSVSGIKGATARLRSPRNVRLGESVMVFGFPLAGSLSSSGNFTSGLVSALRGLRDAAGELQITAPVQPGNSGGPLMDASGLVIGVVQAKLDALRSAIVTGDIPQNINFAISLEVLAGFLVKNRVAFRDGTISAPLDTARVAELAQSFTYRVECRRRSQQAGASPSIIPPSRADPRPDASKGPQQAGTSPSIKPVQRSLPPCPGSYALTWTNCVGPFTFTDGGTYVGEFRDGTFNGQGTVTWPNGMNYVGEFKDGNRSGQGTSTRPDGRKYVGEFRDGKTNGEGTEYRADGSILRSGIWADGVFIRSR
jgi:hypothetical protein